MISCDVSAPSAPHQKNPSYVLRRCSLILDPVVLGSYFVTEDCMSSSLEIAAVTAGGTGKV